MIELVSPDRCREVIKPYREFSDFDPDDWFSKSENYALIEGDNIGMAEYKSPGVYWVHFVYNTARGRAAVDLASAMLKDLCSNRAVNHCIGLIAADNKKAKWVVRQAGMKSLGELDTDIGRCEMFYLEGKI